MLDEVEQRRIEMRALREAEEQSSVRLAAAGREVDAAALEEEDARQRWTDATATFPALANPASLLRARLAVSQAVADSIARSAETRSRLAQAQASTRAAEDAHGAEAESFEMARAHREQVEQKAQEAQRILNDARNALRKAGLENVETRITQLQRRLKEAEERARQTGVAKGIALHQLEAARRRAHAQQETLAQQAAAHFAERSEAFGALLAAVADSLDLPRTRWTIRCATRASSPRAARAASAWMTTCRAPISLAEREQEGFLAAVGEYQAMVGADDRFGLRAPGKRNLALAPQGWLLDVAPRLEGTSDIRLLLNHPGCLHRAVAADARAARHPRRARHHPRRGGERIWPSSCAAPTRSSWG